MYTLPLELKDKERWGNKHNPTLYIRAKYLPYKALRQQFWRAMLKQYDADESGLLDKVELTTMLDTLGSTLHESIVSRRHIMETFSLHSTKPSSVLKISCRPQRQETPRGLDLHQAHRLLRWRLECSRPSIRTARQPPFQCLKQTPWVGKAKKATTCRSTILPTRREKNMSSRSVNVPSATSRS